MADPKEAESPKSIRDLGLFYGQFAHDDLGLASAPPNHLRKCHEDMAMTQAKRQPDT